MSIFKESFPDFISSSLQERQKFIEKDRISNPNQSLTYFNTRNAWIRMTSSVNTINSQGNYSNELAKKYQMFGGILDSKGKLRFGIGKEEASYSKVSPNNNYRLGIRPQPGIESISVETKTAYGSLREVTVKFTCWDIEQLQDLELLYMRPGYSVLIEWGWVYPGNYNTPFLDIFNKENIDLLETIESNYKVIKENKGNYDFHLGKVSNYSWSARSDGGYDCIVYVISYGEVLESLKINYVPFDFLNINKGGLLKDKTNLIESKKEYSKGILNGLLYELNNFINQSSSTAGVITKDNTNYIYFKKSWSSLINKDNKDNQKTQNYITLNSLCDLINKYVLIKNSKSSILKISCYDRKYNNSTEEPLTCIAHPLQLFTNPNICVFDASFWVNKKIGEVIDDSPLENPLDLPQRNQFYPTKEAIAFLEDPYYITLKQYIIAKHKLKNPGNEYSQSLITEYLKLLREETENSIKEIAPPINRENFGFVKREYIPVSKVKFSPKDSFFALFTNTNRLMGDNTYLFQSNKYGFDFLNYMNVSIDDLLNEFINMANKVINPDEDDVKFYKYVKEHANEFKSTLNQELQFKYFETKYAKSLEDRISSKRIQDIYKVAQTQFEGLEEMEDFFVKGSNYRRGIIGNIYVNINFLKSVLSSKSLENRDGQNKGTIKLLDFFQSILLEIQSSIGNINNFDIHIDPYDNIGRIIDINFTNDKGISSKNKSKLVVIETHNLKSIVREGYKIQSQIFSEIMTMISISAQNQPNKLGYNNDTLVGWNRGVKDRLFNEKVSQSENIQNNNTQENNTIFSNFETLLDYFLSFNDNSKITFQPEIYSNALKDLLLYTNKSSNFNNFSPIIPVVLSLPIDGIGGIIIGNIFNINQDILPKGYKGEGIGREIAFIVKGLSHTIQNNDWITTIEAYPVCLDDTTPKVIDYSNKFINIENNKIILNSNPSLNSLLKKGETFSSFITYYAPGQGKTLTQIEMEGGPKDKLGKNIVSNPIIKDGKVTINGISTLNDYLEGKSSFVTVAMDKIFPYGTNLINKNITYKGKPILFKVNDTGTAFYGKGRNKVDIAIIDNENLDIAAGRKLPIFNGLKFPSGQFDGWEFI